MGQAVGGQSLFSGMNVNMQAQPGANQMSAQGGHMTGLTNQMASGQSHMTGSNNLVGASGPGQMNQMMSGQSHMTGTSNPIGQMTNTPLIPTQVPQNEVKSASGWSSNINTGNTSQQMNQQMGWSGGISGTVQSTNLMPQNPGSSSQFSTANQYGGGAQPSNWMAPTQTATVQSSNWMIPNQMSSMQPSNWVSQNQSTHAPTPASLMMQGGPLMPQGNPPSAQPPAQAQMDNPFADLSFLG
jgi:hypothetical protein